MYAITSNSFRAIAGAADALPGETVVSEVPQSLVDSIEAGNVAKNANREVLGAQAVAARDDLKAFLALAAPTNAQTLAAVKLNCRVNLGLIRLVLGMLDGTD